MIILEDYIQADNGLLLPRVRVEKPRSLGAIVAAHTKWIDEPDELYKIQYENDGDKFQASFMRYIYYGCFGAISTPGCIDTGGTTRTLVGNSGMATNAVTAVVVKGARVGIASSAVDMTHYALQNACANGTSTNQFTHGACSAYLAVTNSTSSTRSFNVIRSFTNFSTAAIVVQECGLYGLHANSSTYHMICRDTTGAITVNPSGVLTITYTFSISL